MMAHPVRTSIIREMTDHSSSSHQSVSYYLFIDMEAEEFDDTYSVVMTSTAKHGSDAISSSINELGWCNDLVVELEEILPHLSEQETTMENQYTKVNGIIAQTPTLYLSGLLNGLVFAANSCNL